MTDTGNGRRRSRRRPRQRSGSIVRASDTAPVFPASPDTATVAEGQMLSLPVTATKQEGDPLTYTAQNLPSRRHARPGDSGC